MKKCYGFLAIVVAILFASAAVFAVAESRPSADNSAINARDTKNGPLTPEDQSNQKSDVELTRRIRQALMHDSTLSLTAQNIKIITVQGMVTLRGPVKNLEERARIATMATEVAGPANIDNQLEIITAK